MPCALLGESQLSEEHIMSIFRVKEKECLHKSGIAERNKNGYMKK
jgi:hypothetical protein